MLPADEYGARPPRMVVSAHFWKARKDSMSSYVIDIFKHIIDYFLVSLPWVRASLTRRLT
jgi:hypothetical protein